MDHGSFDRIARIMGRLKVAEDVPIENRMISRSLDSAQKKVEGFHFDQRKNVVKYDDVMNRHRKATYAMRREILHKADIHARIKIFIEEEAAAMLESSLVTSDQFEDVIKSVFPFEEATLDRIFDAEAGKVRDVLVTSAK